MAPVPGAPAGSAGFILDENVQVATPSGSTGPTANLNTPPYTGH